MEIGNNSFRFHPTHPIHRITDLLGVHGSRGTVPADWQDLLLRTDELLLLEEQAWWFLVAMALTYFFWGVASLIVFLPLVLPNKRINVRSMSSHVLLRNVVLKSNWQSVSWKIPFAGQKHLYDKFIELVKRNSWYIDLASIFLGCVCWQPQPILQLCRRGGVMFDLQQSPANLVLFESNYVCFNRIHIPSWFIQSSCKYTGCLKNEKRTRWVCAEPQETDNGKWETLEADRGFWGFIGWWVYEIHIVSPVFCFKVSIFIPTMGRCWFMFRTFLGPNDA